MVMIALVSWVAMILSLVGQLLVNRKNIYAFPLWITANILWIVVNLLGIMNIPQIVMYVVYSICNIHGWMKWQKDIHKQEQKKQP